MMGPKGDKKIFSNSEKQILEDGEEVDLNKKMRSHEIRRY
jgi:hypothetical protein